MTGSLLETVRGLIERTYRIRSGIGELGPFLVGDVGYRRLIASSACRRGIGSADGQGAKTLIRETDDGGVSACIYFPDEMIRRLEAFPPQRGVREENLRAFATFVEEIDHLLVIAERNLGRRPVSLFELELHANVTKYLVLARFAAGSSPRLREHDRIWLRHRLFEEPRFCDEDPAVRERYRAAARRGVQMLDALATLAPAACIEVLRSFHAADLGTKLRLISDLGRAA